MQILASDVMQTSVITVSAETPLLNVHRLFVQEEIHGAPVVDEDGNLRGVISTIDLLRAVEEEYLGGAARTAPFYFRDELPFSGPDWLNTMEDFQDRLALLTAGDVLTTEIVSVGLNTPVSDIATVMRSQQIHRVFVLEQNELRGIITTMDLLQLLESTAPTNRFVDARHDN